MLTIVKVKLESIELLFVDSTVLKTTTQQCLALTRSLQLTLMYVACGYYAWLKRAYGLINTVAAPFQRS
jgi:hypothetical protein